MNAHNKTTQPLVAEYDLEKLLHVFCQTAWHQVNNFSVMEKNEVIRTI